MSRSCYSDDYGDDFPGQLELYRANVARSMRGKKGQARLRELRDALLALPVKRLEAETFAEGHQDAPRVCALGAWALMKTGDTDHARALVGRDADDHETADKLTPFGWPRLVVLDAIYFNDEHQYIYETVEGPRERHEAPYGPIRRAREETPEERYARMLAWVESHIGDTGNTTKDAGRGVSEGDIGAQHDI